MSEGLIIILIAVQVVVLVLLLFRMIKGGSGPSDDVETRLIRESIDRLERTLREEVARNRDETAETARKGREELSASMLALLQSNEQKLGHIRSEFSTGSQAAREEMRDSLNHFSSSVASRMTEIATLQKGRRHSPA